jgi:hypothetical protein
MSAEPRSERERHETVVHEEVADGLPISGNSFRALMRERAAFAERGRLIGDRDDGMRVGENTEAYRRRTQGRST